MKLLATAALVLLASCAAEKPWKQAVVLQGGVRQLKEDFEPVDDNVVYGLEWSGRPADSVLGIEVGGTYSTSDDTGFAPGDELSFADYDLTMLEVYAGPRLTFEAGAARPYLGTGVTYLSSELDISGPGIEVRDAEDSTFGGYVRGGSDFLLGSHVLLGIDLRYIFAADFEEAGEKLEGDSLQLTGRIGWSF